MTLRSFLFTLPIIEAEEHKNDMIQLMEIIIKRELPKLDQRQKIITNGLDFIVVLSSSSDSYHATLRYYHSQELLSIHCEIPDNCPEFGTLPNLSDRLKEKFQAFIKGTEKHRVEAIPPIKRNNAVPVYFVTSDGRILEYDFDEVLVDEDSEYQNIKILHSPTLDNCLLLNDMQNLAEVDLAYTHGLMHHPYNKYKDKDILILGGGDGALLHELLKQSPKFVTMVEIDDKVMKYCQKYLSGACGDALNNFKSDKHEIICGDVSVYLAKFREEGRFFDVIFNDLTDIPISTRENWHNIVEGDAKMWEMIENILDQSMKILKNGGLYLNHAIGVNCLNSLKEYERLLRKLPCQLDFSHHIAYVPSFMEDWVFYQIRKE